MASFDGFAVEHGQYESLALVAQFQREEGDILLDEIEEDEIPHWEGDDIFLDLIETDAPFFSLKLCYEGDTLVSAVLDGRTIKGGNQK